jgi:predicted thioredoxin/glutaredoxin
MSKHDIVLLDDELEEERKDRLREYRHNTRTSKKRLRKALKHGSLYHVEATHMTAFLCNAIDENILGHPSVMTDPDLYELGNTALEVLNELYKKVAQKY